MITRRLIVLAAVLLLANTSFAQSGRLSELAASLSNEAADFADSSYRSYTGSDRNSRADIEAAMLAQQFSGAAQLFNRMVSDRRRTQDLREALLLLQNLARSLDRSTLQRNRGPNIQRLLSDIARELNYDSGGDQYPPSGDQYPSSRSGRMTWRGKVDDDVRIVVRGGRAEVETIGGTPYHDALTNFTASLPPRRVAVRLQSKKGRGEIFLEQQPSRENDYAAVVRIRDPKGGASDYEFELAW